MSDSGRSVGHHHGDLRRAVIEATLSLLREGESAPSLRQAARRAGVSPGAPYHHFKSRQGLMVAVAQEGFQALTSVVQEAAAHEGEPRARLRAMTQAYVCFGLSHPEHYGVMLDPSVAVEDSEEGLRAIALSAFAPLVEAVVACRPELPGEEARHRARTAWASAHGAVLLGRLGAFSKLGGAEGPEGIAEEAARSVLRDVMG